MHSNKISKQNAIRTQKFLEVHQMYTEEKKQDMGLCLASGLTLLEKRMHGGEGELEMRLA